MPKLSVVIITFNEERNIARCLDSVKGIADDIVVVDAKSTDKTEEICRNFNVNFILHEWEGYSGSKNFGNSQAKYDMILSIDADESLSEELKLSIKTIKDKPEAGFYQFNRLTNYLGKWIRHSGWYPDTKLRIFDRRKAKWEGLIHETLVTGKDNKINFLKGDLLHYSYYSISEHIERMNTFTDTAAGELYKKGTRAGWVKIIFKTKIKFLSSYILSLGFLDGYYGFIICILSAFATFLKYSKLRQLHAYKKAK
jgi:glycosyltransferase involved in cell wall biosynthesis